MCYFTRGKNTAYLDQCGARCICFPLTLAIDLLKLALSPLVLCIGGVLIDVCDDHNPGCCTQHCGHVNRFFQHDTLRLLAETWLGRCEVTDAGQEQKGGKSAEGKDPEAGVPYPEEPVVAPGPRQPGEERERVDLCFNSCCFYATCRRHPEKCCKSFYTFCYPCDVFFDLIKLPLLLVLCLLGACVVDGKDPSDGWVQLCSLMTSWLREDVVKILTNSCHCRGDDDMCGDVCYFGCCKYTPPEEDRAVCVFAYPFNFAFDILKIIVIPVYLLVAMVFALLECLFDGSDRKSVV